MKKNDYNGALDEAKRQHRQEFQLAYLAALKEVDAEKQRQAKADAIVAALEEWFAEE